MSTVLQMIDDIRNYGWHVVHVPSRKLRPPFAYTIGLYKSFQAPEVFVSGLEKDDAQGVLDAIADDTSKGQKIEAGVNVENFLEGGYGCYFEFVDSVYYHAYFRMAISFYQGAHFPILQCVWPDDRHLYPWQTRRPFYQDVLIKEALRHKRFGLLSPEKCHGYETLADQWKWLTLHWSKGW